MTRHASLEAVLGAAQPPEVVNRLEDYAAELLRWNQSINLIGRSTEGDLWERHVLEGAAVCRHAPSNVALWVDIGSGGGVPGMVVAIVLAHAQPGARVHLIESDRRKSAFLTATAAKLKLDLGVIAARSEDVPPKGADVVSARALAPLPELCRHAARHLGRGGLALFPKGRNFQTEIDQMPAEATANITVHPMPGSDASVILEVRAAAFAAKGAQ